MPRSATVSAPRCRPALSSDRAHRRRARRCVTQSPRNPRFRLSVSDRCRVPAPSRRPRRRVTGIAHSVPTTWRAAARFPRRPRAKRCTNATHRASRHAPPSRAGGSCSSTRGLDQRHAALRLGHSVACAGPPATSRPATPTMLQPCAARQPRGHRRGRAEAPARRPHGRDGSGNSSLVFDTIHTEAQRELVEAFSTYVPPPAAPPLAQPVEAIRKHLPLSHRFLFRRRARASPPSSPNPAPDRSETSKLPVPSRGC